MAAVYFGVLASSRLTPAVINCFDLNNTSGYEVHQELRRLRQRGAEREGRRLTASTDSEQNLAQVLDVAADNYGGRVAWGHLENGVTYAELRRLAWRIADRLAATDCDHLALTSGNDILVPAALFGAAYAGRTYVPLNGRLPRASVDALLDRLRPVALADYTWLEHNEAARPTIGIEDKRPALLAFTSGTSAEPKGVVLHHYQLLGGALRQSPGTANENEVVLLTAPPFHVPNVVLILGSVQAGRRILPLEGERFSAEAWLDAVEAERITHALVVPTMLHRIVEAQETSPRDVSSLQRLTYGSSRMPRPVLEQALRLFPDTAFLNGYGLTETGGAVTVLSPDDHRAAAASTRPDDNARLSSVGRPLPGVEIRIVGEDGHVLPVRAPGEIQIRATQVSERYLGESSKVDPEGWLRSGDHGWLDEDGYLFCVGRGDDTIIRGGENIGAAEIEDVLLQHPAIAAATVVGLPDHEWGERIAAMIVLRAGHTTSADEARQWVRDRLGTLKTPVIVEIAAELPYTATGKVLRRVVREALIREI